jgi:hypothetical protein
MCINGYRSDTFGNTGNGYWVDAEVDLECTYVDTISKNVVTMFWTVFVRLGQYAASNYVHKMINNPTGYQAIPKADSPTCILPAGTSVNPTSWTFDEWT